jgi:hypothetical protein
MEENLWTISDVAAYLRISRRKAAYLRSQGRMLRPVAMLGRSLRFD